MLQPRYYSDDSGTYSYVSWWLIVIIIIIVIKICFVVFICIRCHRRRKRLEAQRAAAIAGAHSYPGQAQVPLGQIPATGPGYVPPPMYAVAAGGGEKGQLQTSGVAERSLDNAEVEHAPPPPMQPPAAAVIHPAPVQYQPVSELPTRPGSK